MATALQAWEARRDEELSFNKNDKIRVIEKAEAEMANGLSADQPYTWFHGELRGEVGLFPTTQFLYKPSGKPVLDDDNIHIFRNVSMLDATDLYIRYSAGEVRACVMYIFSRKCRFSCHCLQAFCDPDQSRDPAASGNMSEEISCCRVALAKKTPKVGLQPTFQNT